MMVRCVDNSYLRVRNKPNLLSFIGGNPEEVPEKQVPLVIDERYLVVAIAFGPFVPWYFIDDRLSGLSYPELYPADFFEITDSRFSRYWSRGKWVDRLDGQHVIFATDEWNKCDGFHGKLFSGDNQAKLIYQSNLIKLRAEYDLPWIVRKAVHLENGWVCDEDYLESWKADELDEMTTHPSTGELLKLR